MSTSAQPKMSPAPVPLVEDSTMLLSLRNSDFDAYSAYGEVIDNSIQAKAKNIKIKFEVMRESKNQEHISFLAFGDDGEGMPAEVLHKCLQLGYSTRFNDRSGIGRFGVGATLAAINQCKKVEIYSKQSGGTWLYTYVDLDAITGKNPKMKGIPEPIAKNLPDNFKNLVPAKHGTLVIWSKYDRQHDNAPDIIEEFRIWAGRTYRKFIWNQVPGYDGPLEIFIDGKVVYAIDPLYVTTEKTAFPDDKPAHEFDEQTLPWDIPSDDRDDENGGPVSSIIKIRMSQLPEELSPADKGERTRGAELRHIDRNEGISILRNGREVFFGHIPFWGRQFEWQDRWWGCEVSFDAVLDSAFTVKNIKRGAVPNKELKKALYEKIDPTTKTIKLNVKAYWDQKKSNEHKSDEDAGVETKHKDAEEIASKARLARNVIDQDKDVNEEARKYAETHFANATAQQKAAWVAKFQSQPFSIIQDSWKGSSFFEAQHLGGKSVLKYNTLHSFFGEIDEIIKTIEAQGTGELEARRLKTLIDLLIMSFAKAGASFDAKITVKNVSDFMDELCMNWGHYLNSYIKVLKEEGKGS